MTKEKIKTPEMDLISGLTREYLKNFSERTGEFAYPEVLKHIQGRIQEIEKRGFEDYEMLARAEGLTVEDLKIELQMFIERTLPALNFYVARGIKGVLNILKEERFKTQYETSTSSGSFMPFKRAKAEMEFFGENVPLLPRDVSYSLFLGDVNPPYVVYGYASPSLFGKSPSGFDPEVLFADRESRKMIYPDAILPQYGPVVFQLKPGVAKSRGCITFGDSLASENNITPTPILAPHFTSFDSRYLALIFCYLQGPGRVLKKKFESEFGEPFRLTNVFKKDPFPIYWSDRYIEVQILGGLRMEDISRIIVHRDITQVKYGREINLTEKEIEALVRAYREYKKFHPNSSLRLEIVDWEGNIITSYE